MKITLSILCVVFCNIILFAQSIIAGKVFVNERKYYSENRQYYLVFQNDGNLVMYNKNRSSVWDSKTTNKGMRAEFQRDGNLVVYNSSGVPVFSTNTNGRGNSLIIQNDGNVVIYGNRNSVVWASKDNGSSQSGNYNTGIIYKDKRIIKNSKVYSENGEYYLTFQTDGNLVVYYKNSTSPFWASNTVGVGNRAIFQSDGNLVVYDKSNRAVFNTNTSNKNSDRLVIQNDGNLVIYNTSGASVWATR